MVSCGLGVTLVPNIAAGQHRIGIVYREPTRRLELVELSLLWRADDTEPLLHQFLGSAEITHFSPLRGGSNHRGVNRPIDVENALSAPSPG